MATSRSTWQKWVDRKIDKMRKDPEIFEYWRTCAYCHAWYSVPLCIYDDGTDGLFFCSTQCQLDHRMSGEQLITSISDPDRISFALHAVDGIPSHLLMEHFEELRSLTNRWYLEREYQHK